VARAASSSFVTSHLGSRESLKRGARAIANGVDYLDLSDYLAIAERVLGIPAETLIRFDRLVALAGSALAGSALAGSALAAPAGGYGGIEAYPEFVEKAAVRRRVSAGPA
jgi:hypothetical protein